jgi:chlorobactene glucosyltransferase
MEYDHTLFIFLTLIISVVFFSWIYLFIYTIKFLKQVPKLQSFKLSNINLPKVSVILPARNEEKYIQSCLESLIDQDYNNYEIIVINDSSTDNTGELIRNFSSINPKIILVEVNMKPVGWTGKNWACYQGYLNSRGDLFLFTDADSIHSSTSISLAVNHLLFKELDALTAVPKILTTDFWTKITIPILWTLSLVKYSPLSANNPNSKLGYFFGSFFIITRKTYEAIGTHKSVRKEIIEDGALGKKVKEYGFKLNVVHGKDHIQAIWARDSSTLWHGLRRLMVSLLHREKITTYLMVLGTFLILLLPLIVFPFSLSHILQQENIIIYDINLNIILFFFVFASLLLLIITSILQSKYILLQNIRYSLYFPLGCSFVFVAFLTSILNLGNRYAVNWKNRIYNINEHDDSS